MSQENEQKIVLNVTKSLTGKRWILKEYDERLALTFSQKLGESEIIGRLMASRNVQLNEAEYYLDPKLKNYMEDPAHLKDMDKASQRIMEAIQKKEKICIYGDYDVDGATSSALLIRYFKFFNIEPLVYIPDRISEGYGPNIKAFEKIKAQGISLIITVDCGTTSYEPLKFAKNEGLDIIVIDHHIGEPLLPEALAVVNPNRFDETSIYKNLAAVGMCFLLCVNTNRILRKHGFFNTITEPNLTSLLDLVALGTVSDVMLLTGLNRAYVAQGLKVMAQRTNIGINALAESAGVFEPLSAYHLGFIIGPRINAGGRVGEADLGARILSSDDSIEVKEIAQKLEIYNDERKAIQEHVLIEALEQVQEERPLSIIVSSEGWHPGVVGIVSGRLKDQYHCPTWVMSIENGIAKGSGRSVYGFDLGNWVHQAKNEGLILNGGGHAMAAGLTMNAELIPNLKKFLNENIEKYCPKDSLIPKIVLDDVLSVGSIHENLLLTLEKIAPFGNGNPTPKFAMSYVQLVKANIIGQNHLKCFFKGQCGNTIEGILFRAFDLGIGAKILESQGEFFHIAGTLKQDSFHNRKKIKFFIDDISFI